MKWSLNRSLDFLLPFTPEPLGIGRPRANHLFAPLTANAYDNYLQSVHKVTHKFSKDSSKSFWEKICILQGGPKKSCIPISAVNYLNESLCLFFRSELCANDYILQKGPL